MSPERAARGAASSSVAPICLIWALPASSHRARSARPVNEASSRNELQEVRREASRPPQPRAPAQAGEVPSTRARDDARGGPVRARARIRLPELAAARPSRPGARSRGHRAAPRRRRPRGARGGARRRPRGRPPSRSTASSRSSTSSAAPSGAAPTSANARACSSRQGPTPTRSPTKSKTEATGTSTRCGARSIATTRC